MATVEIPDALAVKLAGEAKALGVSVEARLSDILGPAISPPENREPERMADGMAALKRFLERIPAISWVHTSEPAEAYWWAKLRINIESPLAWHAVQALGFVLNCISLEEPLPTVFKPVSPPPYLNGGPQDFLSWVIEAAIPFVDAGLIAQNLEEHLPCPVEDASLWDLDSA